MTKSVQLGVRKNIGWSRTATRRSARNRRWASSVTLRQPLRASFCAPVADCWTKTLQRKLLWFCLARSSFRICRSFLHSIKTLFSSAPA